MTPLPEGATSRLCFVITDPLQCTLLLLPWNRPFLCVQIKMKKVIEDFRVFFKDIFRPNSAVLPSTPLHIRDIKTS